MPSKIKRNGKVVGWLAQIRRMGVSKSQKVDTLDQAKSIEAQWISEIESEANRTTPTVLEWATAYLDDVEQRYTRRTYQEKREALDILVTRFSKSLEVDRIETADALKMLNAVAKKRSGYAANKVRKNLVAAWNWGSTYYRKTWPQEANPFAQVKTYPYQKQGRYIPPMEDVEAVLKVMPEEDHAMLLAYLHTGARRDEVFRLQWKDIDFANNRLSLWTRKRKGGSLEADSIPMTGALREALLKLRGGSDGKGLIFTWQGRKYKYRRHWLEYWCGVAGVPKFTFHSIRHLTASWLDRNGVPLRTIQAVLRHKSATTTNRYLHELRGADVDLDRVFGEQEGKVLGMKRASGKDDTGGSF